MATYEDKSDELLAAVDSKVQAKLERCGQMVEDTVGEIVAVKTGQTRDSRDHVLRTNEVEIGVKTPWAPFLETGTSKMPPHPFLRPALLIRKNDIAEEFSK